jgi:hypothetical protein
VNHDGGMGRRRRLGHAGRMGALMSRVAGRRREDRRFGRARQEQGGRATYDSWAGVGIE